VRFTAAVAVSVAAGFVVAAPALGDPSGIAAKQAEVQNVLNQIQGLDANLEQAIAAYDSATVKLHKIEGDLRTNTYELHVAKANLQRSQRVLSRRLVTLYTTGDNSSSTLGILLGAGSIGSMLDQIETVDRVSGQDVQVNRQVVSFKHQVKVRRMRLQQARAEQRDVVAQRAAQKASIQQQLSERRQLVASIRSEIVRMKAEEAARQRELAREAAARQAAAAAAPLVRTPSGTGGTSSS
jgi:peptidoglycan hydrolase CwlO-like protein